MMKRTTYSLDMLPQALHIERRRIPIPCWCGHESRLHRRIRPRHVTTRGSDVARTGPV